METTEDLTQTQQPDVGQGNPMTQDPGAPDGSNEADRTGRSAPVEDDDDGGVEGLTEQAREGRRASKKLNERFREMSGEIRSRDAVIEAQNRVLEQITGRRHEEQPQRRDQQSADPKPSRDDPQWAERDYEEFSGALAAWNARQATRELFAERDRSAAANQQRLEQGRVVQEVLHNHSARIGGYLKDNPSFQEVIDSEAELHPGASFLIQMSEDGPVVLDELHRQPELLRRLNSMRAPYQMIDFIGRIAGAAKARGPQATKDRPAPARTTGNRPSSSNDEAPEDTAAYFAWANKKFGKS